MSSGTNEQHTNCCNGRSLVVDVFGTHVLDGLSIDSLLRHRNTLHNVKHSPTQCMYLLHLFSHYPLFY